MPFHKTLVKMLLFVVAFSACLSNAFAEGDIQSSCRSKLSKKGAMIFMMECNKKEPKNLIWKSSGKKLPGI